MTKLFTLTKIIVCILIFIQIGFSQDIEKQDKNARFIRAVQSLEKDPLGEPAKETRNWALRYSENINNPHCANLSFIFFAQEVRGEVISQYLIKAAAYYLEQEGKKYNTNDAQLAALTSALNVYERIIENDNSAKYKKLDELVKLKNTSKLIKTVESAKCK